MTMANSTRVLVVEDSASQTKRIRSVLESYGLVVTTASDGIKGFEAFRANEYDLVLSDVMMPGMLGYDLCKLIKGHPKGADIPFVLLTSLSKPIDLIRGLECGADNYIYKPYQNEGLISRIKTIFENKQARANAEPGDSGEVLFMGQRFKITSSRERILDYLGSTFDDFVHARHREYESALSREKQLAQAETFKLREEMLRKEKESLKRLHNFLQSTLDALTTRIAILDASGKILAVNAAWRKSVGAIVEVGQNCEVGVNYIEACESYGQPQSRENIALTDGIRGVIAGRLEEFSQEHACHGVDSKRWVNIRITRFGESDLIRVVVAHEDITQRKLAEEKIIHEANHDALTGLANRARFTERLGGELHRCRRFADHIFSVLFLDLDGFKVVNDSLGHVVGDQLLTEIGNRLSACLRDGDTVARFGGDEFALLIRNIRGIDDVLRLVDRIHRTLSKPFVVGELEVFTAASIGIAMSTSKYDGPVEMLRDADIAMYRAKNMGKGQHVIFDQAMHTSVVNRLKLETDLRRAIERSEFRVEYQPIIEIESERITGFEALVRWNHPERGTVSPAEFIPAAEETGLIIPLDRLVIREACRQITEWNKQGLAPYPLTISVNLSSKQFANADLLDRLDQILEDTGLNPAHLRIEVTESAIVDHAESAAMKIRMIKQRGITLSMDDFGTGYSSLSYLHRFPFNILKIDRSFVSRIGPNGEDSEIVSTIVALAHNLGMSVVAEGVETIEQVNRLRLLNCQYAQGYYYSKPFKPEKAAEVVKRFTSHLCVAGAS